MKIEQNNPLHPGKFIKRTYLEPFDLGINEVARKLGVSPSTFGRLIKEQSNVAPAMALRLSKVIGRSPESWLQMQNKYDLHNEIQTVDLKQCEPIDFSTR